MLTARSDKEFHLFPTTDIPNPEELRVTIELESLRGFPFGNVNFIHISFELEYLSFDGLRAASIEAAKLLSHHIQSKVILTPERESEEIDGN